MRAARKAPMARRESDTQSSVCRSAAGSPSPVTPQTLMEAGGGGSVLARATSLVSCSDDDVVVVESEEDKGVV